MSNSTLREPSRSDRGAAAAFPILMRLPDLRSSKSAGKPIAPAAAEAVAVTPPAAESLKTDDQPQEETLAAIAAVEAPTEPTVSPQPEPISSAPAPSASSDALNSASDMLAETPGPQPSVEDEKPSPKSELDADLTNAAPADVPEPVSPAAARRQRALERQRRQVVAPPQQRTWWTSHFPVIAIGFLIALVLTITAARYSRAVQRANEQAASDPEVPTLDIDIGGTSDADSFPQPEPAMLAAGEADSATSPAADPAPASKSPPLLSVKPKSPGTEATADAEAARTAARPVGGAEPADEDQFVSATSAEATPTAAESTANAAADYPSTEPAAYRPGGRVPREARVPTYPQTSTPNLR